MWGTSPPAWLARPPSSAICVTRGRIAAIASAITLFWLVISTFLATSKSDAKITTDPVPGIRPYTGWPDPLPRHPPHPKEAGSGWRPTERLIVKVRVEEEDVSWLDKIHWIWRNEVITVEPMYSKAHPKAHRPDKGRVANAYLKWIIENYHHLPLTLVLLPPEDPVDLHLKQTSTFDLQHSLRHLQTAFVQSSGFANLECPTHRSQTTCNGKALLSKSTSYELRTLEVKIPDIWKKFFGDAVDVPEQIASVLGAQIAVSRDQVQKRSLEDYLKYWKWLNDTIMDDDSSGLVFEYIWHVIFGKDAVYCPEKEKCKCDAYGECT